MATMEVRLATIPDLDFVQQDGYIPVDVVKRKIEWQEVFIAELGAVSVGYLRLEYLWSSIPYIALIYVMPEHRHNGVGKTMLQFVEEFLRNRGHNVLYSSSQSNEAEAQMWHRHTGFEDCGIISGINAGGVGEVIFRKQL